MSDSRSLSGTRLDALALPPALAEALVRSVGDGLALRPTSLPPAERVVVRGPGSAVVEELGEAGASAE